MKYVLKYYRIQFLVSKSNILNYTYLYAVNTSHLKKKLVALTINENILLKICRMSEDEYAVHKFI